MKKTIARTATTSMFGTGALVMGAALSLALVGGVATMTGCSKPNDNAEPAQEATASQETTAEDLISEEEAIKIATNHVAGDNNVTDVKAELSGGSSEPRYTVTFHFDDADYIVKVGAHDGAVWYATVVFNDGTTRDFEEQKALDAQPAEGEETDQDSNDGEDADEDADDGENAE